MHDVQPQSCVQFLERVFCDCILSFAAVLLEEQSLSVCEPVRCYARRILLDGSSGARGIGTRGRAIMPSSSPMPSSSTVILITTAPRLEQIRDPAFKDTVDDYVYRHPALPISSLVQQTSQLMVRIGRA